MASLQIQSKEHFRCLINPNKFEQIKSNDRIIGNASNYKCKVLHLHYTIFTPVSDNEGILQPHTAIDANVHAWSHLHNANKPLTLASLFIISNRGQIN